DDVDRSVRSDEASVSDAGNDRDETGSSIAPSVDGGCRLDTDCPILDPCLTPRCELSTRRCLYATCQPMACQRAACNAGPPRTCTQTVEQFPLLAGDLGLPNVTIGCNADARQCFAAVYPFAFVGT